MSYPIVKYWLLLSSSLSPFPLSNILKVLSSPTMWEKYKGKQIKKKQNVFFTVDMIIYIKQSKKSTLRKLLDLKSKFGQILGIKVNI